MSDLQQPERRELGDALEDVGGESGDFVTVEEHAAGRVREVARYGGEAPVHPVEHPARRVLIPVERVT